MPAHTNADTHTQIEIHIEIHRDGDTDGNRDTYFCGYKFTTAGRTVRSEEHSWYSVHYIYRHILNYELALIQGVIKIAI